MLWRKCAGRIIEIGPLEHQLHGQIVPRLGAMAHDDFELGEEPADLVEIFDLLGFHRDSRPRYADIEQNGQPQLLGTGIDRKQIFVVDRHLRQRSSRKAAYRRKANFGMNALDPAHFFHAPVGIDRQVEEEAVAEHLLGTPRGVVSVPADQRAFDVEAVHLVDSPFYKIIGLAGLRHVFEHVLRGHRKLLERLGVLDQRPEWRKPFSPVLGFRDAQHAIDDLDVSGHAHGHCAP